MIKKLINLLALFYISLTALVVIADYDNINEQGFYILSKSHPEPKLFDTSELISEQLIIYGNVENSALVEEIMQYFVIQQNEEEYNIIYYNYDFDENRNLQDEIYKAVEATGLSRYNIPNIYIEQQDANIVINLVEFPISDEINIENADNFNEFLKSEMVNIIYEKHGIVENNKID